MNFLLTLETLPTPSLASVFGLKIFFFQISLVSGDITAEKYF